MKKLLLALSVVFITTQAQADGLVLDYSKPKQSQCSTTDYAIGVGTALAVGTVGGIAAMATLPLVGPGVAAGTVDGWRFAAVPFVTTTAKFVAGHTALVGSWVGWYAGALSCGLHRK